MSDSCVSPQNVTRTDKAPSPGNYSQGILLDPTQILATHIISGQTGNTPQNRDTLERVVKGGIGPQTTQALYNILAIMRDEYGRATPNQIVSTRVYLKDMLGDKAEFEVAYKAFFEGYRFPARECVEVSEIPLVSEDTVVEISAFAAYPKNPHFL